MRKYINLIESITERIVYHGTSQENWRKMPKAGDLYVATKREVAEAYAREWEDEGETPLLVIIDLDAVAQVAGVAMEPNWETVEQYASGHWGTPTKPADDLTWEDTAKMNGTFVISGFNEACKKIVSIEEI